VWGTIVSQDKSAEEEALALSQMFQLAGTDQPNWQPEELSSLWQHQLNAPIDFDLTQFGGFSPPEFNDLQQTTGPDIGTFGQLLHHRCPPVELLEATKQFAKACRSGQCSLPDEIATMLYISSIVAAASRGSRRISKLDDQALCHALDWAGLQKWLDPATRELIDEGYQLIQKPDTAKPPE
jgi:hypothetical protein